MFTRRNFYLLGLFFIFSSCGTTPKQNFETVRLVPSDKIYSSARELAEIPQPKVMLNEKPIDLNFSQKSPIVKTEFGPSTAEVIQFTVDKTKNFLTVWAWAHPIKSVNQGVVIPSLDVFDSKGNAEIVKQVQIGEDKSCSILKKCFKTTYDISNLDKGVYSLVLIAKVEDTEKAIDRMNIEASTMVKPRVDVYADFFGNTRVSLESKLPLKIEK